MRIAQITLNGYRNYGNILQKFALHHTLKKFAEDAEVLWLGGNSFLPETGGKNIAQCVQFKERRDWEKIFYLREAVRQSKFKDFENLYISTRFEVPYLEDIADEYDFFVVGSDQVWHPKFHPSFIFFEFVPTEKKISYAASFSKSALPAEKEELFRRGISDYNYVSVREEDAATLVKNLTGKTPSVMPDPVMLLRENEWLAVAQKPTWFKEKYQRGYILTYYLRKLPPPEVQTIADELNLPVINLLDARNYDFFTVGPAEFVWLFAHASLIFTNSFHGVAFSILFRKPFLNREIEGDGGVSMSTRMLTVLKIFGLEDRRTFGEKVFTAQKALDIDFSRRDEALVLERERAFKFLSKALGTLPREKKFGGDAQ